MKSIVILYDSGSGYASEKVFDGKSAKDRTLEWARSVADDVVTLCGCGNVRALLERMAACAAENHADDVIFSFDDVPFINADLTGRLLAQHRKYHAEYTFADGYPLGFAPEIINSQALAIMAGLSAGNLSEAGAKKITHSAIGDFVRSDINAFEVETFIAPDDWRLYRFEFCAKTKADFLACRALYESCKNQGKNPDDFGPDALSELASNSVAVLKTLPKFYSIQICDEINHAALYNPPCAKSEGKKSAMSFEDFDLLIKKISDFSEDAVVSLSVWGEPLRHPDFLRIARRVLSCPELSLFIETDGLLVTDEICGALKSYLESAPESSKNPYPKLMIAVQLDAFTKDGYAKVRADARDGDFERAMGAVSALCGAVPGSVHPQFVRMNENESELEGFFRFWSEKTSPSGGNVIIQKYDDFAGLLPPRKPADLSPLERYVCWHLRRDMTILCNGDVPACRTCLNQGAAGNAITENLESVWRRNDALLESHIKNKLNERCGKCDEYYIFNF